MLLVRSEGATAVHHEPFMGGKKHEQWIKTFAQHCIYSHRLLHNEAMSHPNQAVSIRSQSKLQPAQCCPTFPISVDFYPPKSAYGLLSTV